MKPLSGLERVVKSWVVHSGRRSLRLLCTLGLWVALLGGDAPRVTRLVFTPEEQAWLSVHPVIRLGVDEDFGPYTFVDSDGNLQGVVSGFLAEIEPRLGIRFEIVANLTWPQLIEGVEEHRLDAIATLVRLPERESTFAFTDAYLPTPLVVMTRTETRHLHSVAELKDLRLALVRGYSSSAQLLGKYPALRPHFVSTPLEGLALVASGAADAYVGALGVNQFQAGLNGITNLKVNAGVDMVGNGQSFGVRKDWPQLARLLDKALADIKVERRNEIFQRWLPRQADEIERLSVPNYATRLFPYLVAVLSLALLGYLVVLLWNRQLKLQLARRTSELERAQAIAHMGNWSVEVPGAHIQVSDQIFRLLGRPRPAGPLDWHLLLSWVHPEEQGQHRQFLKRLVHARPGDAWPTVLCHLVRPAGESCWLEISLTVEFDPGGRPLRYLGTAQDVTERNRFQQALLHSQKMEAVGQLTGGIAHDFNNILGIILGNLDRLQEHPFEADAQKRLENIRKTTRRAADLTKQLLSFSRNQSSQKTLTNLNQVIANLDSLINHSVTPEVEVTYHLAEELWLTRVDPGDLEDALINLVINARDAMQGRGLLTLETQNCCLDERDCAAHPAANPGDFVQLTVSDTGAGIPAELRERIFEPFFSTKPQGEGTGLGLSMVFGFIRRSSGAITCESEPGQGAIFRLFLPRAEEGALPPPVSQGLEVSLPRGTETILLVEDEAGLLEIARDTLEFLGYRVLTAANGRLALQLLADRQEIDLLLSDVVMPGGVSGFELAEQATSLRPGIKVLLNSGNPEKAVAHAWHPGLLANLLRKPFTQAELAERVRRALDEPGVV